MADQKTLAADAALDEKAYGPEARASRKKVMEKSEKGDSIGAAVETLKGGYEALKHGLSHPVDATIGGIEVVSTPSAEKKDYLAKEKSR